MAGGGRGGGAYEIYDELISQTRTINFIMQIPRFVQFDGRKLGFRPRAAMRTHVQQSHNPHLRTRVHTINE